MQQLVRGRIQKARTATVDEATNAHHRNSPHRGSEGNQSEPLIGGHETDERLNNSVKAESRKYEVSKIHRDANNIEQRRPNGGGTVASEFERPVHMSSQNQMSHLVSPLVDRDENHVAKTPATPNGDPSNSSTTQFDDDVVDMDLKKFSWSSVEPSSSSDHDESNQENDPEKDEILRSRLDDDDSVSGEDKISSIYDTLPSHTAKLETLRQRTEHHLNATRLGSRRPLVMQYGLSPRNTSPHISTTLDSQEQGDKKYMSSETPSTPSMMRRKMSPRFKVGDLSFSTKSRGEKSPRNARDSPRHLSPRLPSLHQSSPKYRRSSPRNFVENTNSQYPETAPYHISEEDETDDGHLIESVPQVATPRSVKDISTSTASVVHETGTRSSSPRRLPRKSGKPELIPSHAKTEEMRTTNPARRVEETSMQPNSDEFDEKAVDVGSETEANKNQNEILALPLQNGQNPKHSDSPRSSAAITPTSLSLLRLSLERALNRAPLEVGLKGVTSCTTPVANVQNADNGDANKTKVVGNAQSRVDGDGGAVNVSEGQPKMFSFNGPPAGPSPSRQNLTNSSPRPIRDTNMGDAENTNNSTLVPGPTSPTSRGKEDPPTPRGDPPESPRARSAAQEYGRKLMSPRGMAEVAINQDTEASRIHSHEGHYVTPNEAMFPTNGNTERARLMLGRPRGPFQNAVELGQRPNSHWNLSQNGTDRDILTQPTQQTTVSLSYQGGLLVPGELGSNGTSDQFPDAEISKQVTTPHKKVPGGPSKRLAAVPRDEDDPEVPTKNAPMHKTVYAEAATEENPYTGPKPKIPKDETTNDSSSNQQVRGTELQCSSSLTTGTEAQGSLFGRRRGGKVARKPKPAPYRGRSSERRSRSSRQQQEEVVSPDRDEQSVCISTDYSMDTMAFCSSVLGIGLIKEPMDDDLSRDTDSSRNARNAIATRRSKARSSITTLNNIASSVCLGRMTDNYDRAADRLNERMNHALLSMSESDMDSESMREREVYQVGSFTFSQGMISEMTDREEYQYFRNRARRARDHSGCVLM